MKRAQSPPGGDSARMRDGQPHRRLVRLQHLPCLEWDDGLEWDEGSGLDDEWDDGLEWVWDQSWMTGWNGMMG